MENVILEIGGRRWLVREAISEEMALNAIASARCTGSIGCTRKRVDVDGLETVEASVVQINSDGSERQPYTESY